MGHDTDGTDGTDDEFDVVAWWTACAALELGERYVLPAACRGSGSPAGLDWLASSMHLLDGTRLLDSGAGVGGPAEYVARHSGVRPTLADPVVGAGRAARHLFDHPVVTADGARLPFAADTFDAGWSLGVLCTVEDKLAHLRELVRVVRRGGPVGLLVFVRTDDDSFEQPDGNHFPTRSELLADPDDVGLEVTSTTSLSDLASAPADWDNAATQVETAVAHEHRDDPRWQRAQSSEQSVAALIGDELVRGELFACV